jgi:hypothetical protein
MLQIYYNMPKILKLPNIIDSFLLQIFYHIDLVNSTTLWAWVVNSEQVSRTLVNIIEYFKNILAM